MYLSKNSRCVLRKGPWFSSNLFDRNFKVNFMNSRGRWPEDDPSKPPLRLNIPKDAGRSSCHYDAQMNLYRPERTTTSDKLSSKWLRSTSLSPDAKCQYSGSKNSDRDEKEKPLMRTLEEQWNSPERSDNQNCTVKPESSEPSKYQKNSQGVGNNQRKREKNFKFKGTRCYEGIQLNNLPKGLEVEDKDGILTIQIALNDQLEVDNKVMKKSEINTTEDVMSDDQISALAEAIVNELNSKDGVDHQLNKSDQRRNDEAYLVIINVTDKDIVEDSPLVSDICCDRSEEKLTDKASSTVEAQETILNQNLEGYGDSKQVRNLDTCDELEKSKFKKKRARSKKPKKSRKTKSVCHFPIRTEPVFRYIVNGYSKRGDDVEFNRSSMDFFRPNRKEWKKEKKENRYLNNVDLLKEKEMRREIFQKNLRKARMAGDYCYPVGKKLERSKKKEKINVLTEISKRMERSYPLRLTEPAFTHPIEYTPEREMRMGTKIIPEHHFENKIEVFGEDILKTEEPAISSFILKPLSKQIKLVDELPELLKYPEYKYSVLKKSKDDERFKLNLRTIRSYHNSCKSYCKLTDGSIGDQPPLIIMHKLEKIDEKNDFHKSVDVGKGDGGASFSLNTDLLREEYPLSKLDNSLNTCSDNDIYFQEGNEINNILTPTVTNNVESTDNAKQSLEGIKSGNSRSYDKCDEERYELDISDVSADRTKGFEGLYEMALPVKKSVVEDEIRMRKVNRVKEFGKLSVDNFEMNKKCLDEKESGANPPSNKTSSIGESLLNSKKDAIINVVKKEVNTPKISDNIVNLANEGLAENKGTITVDSLSMMKKVKEIVDLDLKNAEKIFISTGSGSEDQSGKVRKKILKRMNSHMLKSVVIHNQETNAFYVDSSELYSIKTGKHVPSNLCNKDSFSYDEKEVDINKGEIRDDSLVYVDIPKGNIKYIVKNGDSIIVYDEQTKEWRVDFTLVNKKRNKSESERNEDDVSSEKCRRARGVKEDSFPPKTVENVTKTGANVKKKESEFSNVSEKNIPGEEKKFKKETAKEMDAQEIRKKNSDLYDDVFDLMKENKSESEVEHLKKRVDESEKNSSEHYVSKNIVEMSKGNGAGKSKKFKSSKVETVKLNITSAKRPPSKVKEINLNQKIDEDKDSGKKDKTETAGTEPKKQDGAFYEDMEKYKTPFTDPEYEEKQLKINSGLESNPNLKKLDSWNKTLVLQEMSKSNENIESWLKDETDKMATLLLKVLQEAAEGNQRRRTAGKIPGKRNPYEAIRKKQENGLTRAKKKEPGKKKVVPVNIRTGNKILDELAQNVMDGHVRKKEGLAALGDASFVEIAKAEFFSTKDAFQKIGGSSGGKENAAEDIPGPHFLNRLSSLWKFLPEIGCQATIFLTIGMFSMAKTGLSFLRSDVTKTRNDPFRGLFAKYGPVVKIRGPLSGDVVLINRPEDISNVFTQGQTSRSVLDSLENCRTQVQQKSFPTGITDSCNGIDWDIVRKSMIDVSNKGCLHYFNMLKNTNTMLVNKIETIRNKQNQVPDDFICELKKWSMEGLCNVLLDKSFGFLEQKNSQIHWVCESERFLRHFQEATHALCQCESKFQLWRFLNTPAMNNLNQAYRSLDLIISKYVYQAEISLRKKKKAINSHKQNTNNSLNFLESILLNDRMAPEEITANIIDMMLIGVNTTTVALGFLLYNLAQNSRVQLQLFKEVKEVLPKKSSEINYHQLHSLKYLQACMKESMRINVPIPFVLRILPSDISVAQYQIPYGTHMIMDTQMACMKEQNFDEPERFKPERWLDQESIHPFSSIPFSNGPRAGFVKHLTEIHLWTCIAKIVRNYQIDYHFGEIKPTGKVISYPDKPLKLTFLERDE